MGDESPSDHKRVVKFYLLKSLPDPRPIIVKRRCHTTRDYRCRYQNLIPVPEVLSNSPSLQEVLWNFSRFKDEDKRLTLRENPHFYAKLPASPKAYRGGVKIDPTEDFRHANKFYVLTDKLEPVYIMIGQVLQPFGNLWCPQNAIIFKGMGVLFLSFPVFLISFQISMGGSGGKGSSRHLLEEHTVGSVSSSQCPPFQARFQELLGIIVDCSQLLQRGAH